MRFYSSHFKQGSVVLVQGAASGLGRAISKIYAKRGSPLVVTDRDEKGLKTLVEECASEFGNKNVHMVAGDATKEEDCRQICEFAVRTCGRIDVAVLCAGVGAHQKFEDMKDLGAIYKMMQINFMGAVHMTKYLLAPLKQTKGNLVVINSMSGVVSTPMRSGYCASKHAVTGFFNSLHHEVGD